LLEKGNFGALRYLLEDFAPEPVLITVVIDEPHPFTLCHRPNRLEISGCMARKKERGPRGARASLDPTATL
jgi:hypothetical protein